MSVTDWNAQSIVQAAKRIANQLPHRAPWWPLAVLWLVWSAMSMAVMSGYVSRYQFSRQLLWPHLAVISCVFVLLLCACAAIALLRVPASVRRSLIVAVLAGAHFVLLVCYALFFIGCTWVCGIE